jgi:hypothetical protein
MEYNKENYEKQIAEIEKEAAERKTALVILYASENNPYKIGDVVSDHSGSIIIEKITATVYWTTKFPCCSYWGLELKKDGTLRKDKSKRSVHQLNIIK